jgi:hypothetical protein
MVMDVAGPETPSWVKRHAMNPFQLEKVIPSHPVIPSLSRDLCAMPGTPSGIERGA